MEYQTAQRIAVALICGVVGAWAQPKAPAVPASVGRSVSASKQFVIYHPDGVMRSKVARAAEAIRSVWLRRMRVSSDWAWPVVIQLPSVRPRGYPALVASIFEADGATMKVQIDVYDPGLVGKAAFDIEVLRALAWEFIYRDAPPKAGRPVAQPPTWLLDGLWEDHLADSEGLPPGLYERLIESGPPPKLEAFLKLRPEGMDTSSRAIFRAQSLGLLRALFQLDPTAAGLRAYLSGLPSGSATDPSELVRHFPALEADPGLLAKMWTLAIAKVSSAQRVKPMRLEESESALALLIDREALVDPRKPEKGMVKGSAALAAMARSDGGPHQMRLLAEDLLRLEIRVHPLFRPIVEEYRVIVSGLAEKPRKDYRKRLQKNDELRAALGARGGEVSDYLNWFEATQFNSGASTFDLSTASEPTPARGDAISRILDSMEATGW